MILWDNVLMLVLVSLACWKCLELGLWVGEKILKIYGDDEE